jgi:hypothetical protein
MQGTIECCHWRKYRDRESIRGHLPRVESVGAEHGVDSLHLRQRRTEKLTELAGAEEVVEVRRVPIRQRCDEGGHGRRIWQL